MPCTPGLKEFETIENVKAIDPNDPNLNCLSIAVDDIDCDSNVDIVVGNIFGTNSANILWNNGKRKFSVANLLLYTRNTTDLAEVDFNGGAYPDITIGNYNGPNQVAMNNGNRGFNVTDVPSIDQTYRTTTIAMMLFQIYR